MRCFISIDIDKDLRWRIGKVQKKLSCLDVDMKLVESENLHFTVKFIGNVNENEVGEIKGSLERCLKHTGTSVIKVEGLGYFGSPSHIRTLWLGVKEGRDELMKIMKNVNENVKIGDCKLSPHLTIGRMKSGRNMEILFKLMNEMKDVKVGEMHVNEVILKSSELTGKGPMYSDLATFKLGCEYE